MAAWLLRDTVPRGTLHVDTGTQQGEEYYDDGDDYGEYADEEGGYGPTDEMMERYNAAMGVSPSLAAAKKKMLGATRRRDGSVGGLDFGDSPRFREQPLSPGPGDYVKHERKEKGVVWGATPRFPAAKDTPGPACYAKETIRRFRPHSDRKFSVDKLPREQQEQQQGHLATSPIKRSSKARARQQQKHQVQLRRRQQKDHFGYADQTENSRRERAPASVRSAVRGSQHTYLAPARITPRSAVATGTVHGDLYIETHSSLLNQNGPQCYGQFVVEPHQRTASGRRRARAAASMRRGVGGGGGGGGGSGAGGRGTTAPAATMSRSPRFAASEKSPGPGSYSAPVKRTGRTLPSRPNVFY